MDSKTQGHMVNITFIIRTAVAAQRNDFTVNVIQKIQNNRCVVAAVGSHLCGDDLLSLAVHRNVEFTPSSAFAPSVFVNLPFVLAVNLQTSTFDHNVKRTALAVHLERNVQRFRTFAKGRIVGNACFLNFEERKHIPPKSFGASIGKVEDFANDQQRFNRRIAVNKGTTATVTLISVVPKLQYVVAEPERNVPAIN